MSFIRSDFSIFLLYQFRHIQICVYKVLFFCKNLLDLLLLFQHLNDRKRSEKYFQEFQMEHAVSTHRIQLECS